MNERESLRDFIYELTVRKKAALGGAAAGLLSGRGISGALVGGALGAGAAAFAQSKKSRQKDLASEIKLKKAQGRGDKASRYATKLKQHQIKYGKQT